MEKVVVKTQFGADDLVLESGKLATNASAAVCATFGGTTVLATVTVGREPRENVDYLPLLVDYEERLYAAGKISGSRFIKREGRPTEQAILNCRMIDRSLRPMFPKEFRRDIQVIVTILSYDGSHDPDIAALNAASAALLISPAPFDQPVAACHIAGDIVNPTPEQLAESTFDVVVAGLKDGKIIMIETIAKEAKEEEIKQAISLGIESLKPVFQAQEELKKLFLAKNPRIQEEEEKEEALDKIIVGLDGEEKISPEDLKKKIGQVLGNDLTDWLEIAEERQRQKKIADFEKQVLGNFENNYKQKDLKNALDELIEEQVRQKVLTSGQRPDGRKVEEIRPLNMEVSCLPRTHGSAIFARGQNNHQTQALSIVTLAAPSAEQWLDTMEEFGFKRFMHHYNFPPFCIGEVSPLRSASRREIGHGSLAEKALVNLIPEKEKFPYTIRAVSEILSSNGSSSMASVCGASLALFDAGVPMKKAAAGVAIGLMTDANDENKYQILTDIQGIEDFGGDMDFKVAGTTDGISAIQMDTKLKGLTPKIVDEALERARLARLEILKQMAAIIAEPRAELSPFAPKIETIKIPVEKIGELIGPGGKTINKIIEECGGRDDGMVHISEISRERVPSVSAALKIGQKVKVKVVGVDPERGRIGLSIKQA
ncbi:MAG: polyribonucleotide nucleotidyltransferase [Candidatus Berkelbacteria bacterium Licking1014_2]|uniref:Polyribonucleotide nucleotidyltransferase n=1 Tax=Candidatus Berkelbacteria bacterium Licking1014_2 TaxID=2017146 RepID=A0A554LSG1_9BACT|nr:MAG: polyribonucleotide nucleotidyltransferase [Candidatus Berkelbacteria bacterium Licking1014_2]